LKAEVVSGDRHALNREVLHYKVAAMLVPDFLDYVEAGDLIITPGDRSDIILASLLSYQSSNYPQIAGLLLTGHQAIPPQIQSLIAGLGEMPFPVLAVAGDTFSTALAVSQISGQLSWQDDCPATITLSGWRQLS